MIRKFLPAPKLSGRKIDTRSIPGYDEDSDRKITEVEIPDFFQDGALQKELHQRLWDLYDTDIRGPDYIIAGWAVVDLVRVALDDVLEYPARYGTPRSLPGSASLMGVYADPLDATRMTIVSKDPIGQALRVRWPTKKET